MLLATGKRLPFDTGLYSLCQNTAAPNVSAAHFLVSYANAAGRTTAQFGVCLPDTCTDSDVALLLTEGLHSALLSGEAFAKKVAPFKPELAKRVEMALALADAVLTGLPPPTVTSAADRVPMGPHGYAALAFFAALVAFSAVSTLMDASGSAPESRPAHRGSAACYFQAFSARAGLRKLLAAPIEAAAETSSLNGIRVIAMVWIILGHTLMMPSAITGYDNPMDVVAPWGAAGSPWLQLVLGAELGVDSFFFLSGLLVAQIGFPEIARRKGAVRFPRLILQRYLRLTPAFAVAMLFYAQVAPYVGSGPFFPLYQQSIFRRCSSYWWTGLLYLHNFVPWDSDRVCMGWTWFLGNDMIFFALSTLALLVFYRRRALGWALVGLLTAASIAVTLWLCIEHKLGTYIFDYHYRDYSYWAYSKPYTRIPAYFVGLAAALLGRRGVFAAVDAAASPGLAAAGPDASSGASAASRAGWSLALALSLASLAALVALPTGNFRRPNSWPLWLDALYLTFARPAWAASLAVLVAACRELRRSPVDAFLSHPAWVPFARLTYGAYLVHPVLIKLLAGNATAAVHFSAQDLASRAVANVLCSFAAAAVLYLLVERPVLTLLTLLGGGRQGPHAHRPDDAHHPRAAASGMSGGGTMPGQPAGQVAGVDRSIFRGGLWAVGHGAVVGGGSSGGASVVGGGSGASLFAARRSSSPALNGGEGEEQHEVHVPLLSAEVGSQGVT